MRFFSMEDIAAPSSPAPDGGGKLTYWEMSRLVAGLEDENRQLRRVNESLGSWLSAELNDEQVCPVAKYIVTDWFEANETTKGV